MQLKHDLSNKIQHIIGIGMFRQQCREIMFAFNGLLDLSGKFGIPEQDCPGQVTVMKDKPEIMPISLFIYNIIAAVHWFNLSNAEQFELEDLQRI